MRRWIPIVVALVALAAVSLAIAAPATAQGRPDRPAAEKKNERARGPAAQGQGKGQAARPAQAQGRGNPNAAAARDREQGGPPAHARARRGGPAPDVAAFNRDLVSRAAAVRSRRHADGRGVSVRREGGEIRVVRDDGELLFALDRADAERLGYWRVGVADPFTQTARPSREGGAIFDRAGGAGAGDQGGAPAFCRSGEGHPVWGREWCVDMGFGLGHDGGLWGRATDIDDVIFRRPDTSRGELDRGGLADVLGDIVFGRIALQSLVLGADRPLTGQWLGEADGPRVLRIHAGDLTVAELVDADRDDRADVILFNLGT